MIFSIVIPTHNRLSLAKDAIETVRRQKKDNWELIVFDNASEEDLVGYVESLAHPNIRCVRSDEFLPVTDSWNSALDLAKGDYITVLGDDDGLVPDCFSRLETIVEEFDKPDAIYSSLIQFFQPGVAPWERAGYIANLKNGFFFREKKKPFIVSGEDRAKAVQGSLNLHRNFTFNIQAFFCSRDFLETIRIDNVILHSPFPDYYFANLVFSEAKKIVADPTPLAIASVSKASFGFTLFNGEEEKGNAILNTKLYRDPLYPAVKDHLLPGPAYNTSYIVTMAHLAKHCKKISNTKVNYGRYRRLQIYSAIMRLGPANWADSDVGKEQWKLLGPGEKVWAKLFCKLIAGAQRLQTKQRLKSFGDNILKWVDEKCRAHEFQPKPATLNIGTYQNVDHVFDAIDNNRLQMEPKQVAAVYLARCVDGPDSFVSFVESYNKHSAGLEHDLVVIYKGFENDEDLNNARAIFKDIQTYEVVKSDEGFDINAYLHAANQLNHEYYFFMNTFSTIVTDNWLKLVFDASQQKDVGIVGVSGSYESLYTSYQLIHKVMFLCNMLGLDYDEAIPYYYHFIVKQNQIWIDSKFNARTRFEDNFKGKLKTWREIFRQKWHMKTFKYFYKIQSHCKIKYSEFIEYPPFPNPHIRSNGFFIAKRMLDAYPARPIVQKLDACYFESGAKSLTRFILNSGKRAVIAGKNGEVYDVQNWPKSNTFRLGTQENLIVADNQTNCFLAMPDGEKYTHQRMTWGDYLAPPRSDYYDFNMKFKNRKKIC